MRIFLSIWLAAQIAFASDHIDGPVTTKHRVADLADLYAFPSTDDPNRVVLVANTYFTVKTKGHFDGLVGYRFKLRKASLEKRNFGPKIATSDELTISCTFETPEDHSAHGVTCRTSTDAVVAGKVGEVLVNN